MPKELNKAKIKLAISAIVKGVEIPPSHHLRNGMLQKVKILLNNVDWDVKEQLQAVKDYYSSKIELEFRTM